MSLTHRGFVDLPPHAHAGGFDHAAVHEPTGRIYVAHTGNDAVDVIGCGIMPPASRRSRAPAGEALRYA